MGRTEKKRTQKNRNETEDRMVTYDRTVNRKEDRTKYRIQKVEEDETANRLKEEGHDSLRYNYRYARVI